MISKRLHIGMYECIMLLLVVLASTLRIVLISQHWPVTNSDEAIMDLMALHINNRGEHPIFFYGQAYMGPVEAYIGALCFRLFGASVFSLRLALIPFFALFLISNYFLTRKLYNRSLALFTVVLLCLGSSTIVARQLKAIGGYPEITFLGTFIFLLCSKLALSSSPPNANLRTKKESVGTGSAQGTIPTAPVRKRVGGTTGGQGPALSLRMRIPLLFASWYHAQLAGCDGQKGDQREQRFRWLLYGLLGLFIGLAIWIDQILLPYIVCALVLLFFFCRHECFSRRGLFLWLGIIIGAFPLIYHNFTAPLSQNSLLVLLNTHNAGQQELLAQPTPFLRQLSGTFLISLPSMMGFNPLCEMSQIPPFAANTSISWSCVAIQGGWSLGYLFLWTCAILMASISLRRVRSLRQGRQERNVLELTIQQSETRRQEIVEVARLMLLISALFTLLQYLTSSSSGTTPDPSARYLECMLISTSALLWPLWSRVSIYRARKPFHLDSFGFGSICLLILIGSIFLAGTIRVLLDIPGAQSEYDREQALVQTLLNAGATHFYSEYWTCNRLIFRSNERLICSNLNGVLEADPGLDRYQPYRNSMRESRVTTYVFPQGTPQQQYLDHYLRSTSPATRYTRREFKGYVIYQMATPLGIP